MPENNYLKNNITIIKGVGDARAKLFAKLGVDTVDSLLRFYPRSYEDWSGWGDLIDCMASNGPHNELNSYNEHSPHNERSSLAYVRGQVISGMDEHRVRPGMTLYTCRARDGNGSVFKLTFFNNPYIGRILEPDFEYVFHGKVSFEYAVPEMTSPAFLPLGQAARPVPVYPLTEGLTGRAIAQTVKAALKGLPDPFEDPVPADIRLKYNLCHELYALWQIHQPDSRETLDIARRRLVFDELLLLQLGLIILKDRRGAIYGDIRQPVMMETDRTDEFLSTLPFEPTSAQRRAIADCVRDMTEGARPMSRLVQGDVGSGKTVVAAALCYSCAKCGIQSAVMVPTGILAEQHYETFKKLFENTDIHIELLTGTASAAEKKRIYASLADGSADIVIGTHALISEGVEYKSLGFVVTDEQHRFGVSQRATLAAKGRDPHLLVMSATPIPRTLALIVFGDLDVSIIDEMPLGRLPVKTYWIDGSKRERAYNFIKKQLDEGRQAYMVCPLVDSSESSLSSAEDLAAKLSVESFSGYKVGLLHGKMRPADKEYVMRRFVSGEIQLLVSTTVIEVGVDVPNAAVMLIENADRFGLSQLHQLRGRVGRGAAQSYCILVCDALNRSAAQRMRVMTDSADGFVIAQEDLKLRGPGDFFGSRQHGLPELKIADLSADIKTLEEARHAAEDILARDKALSAPEHALLREMTGELFKDTAIFN